MRRKFKKIVVYLLAVLIVLPSLGISGLFSAEGAKAWSNTIIVDNTDTGTGYVAAGGWSTFSNASGYGGSYDYETGFTTVKTATWMPSVKDTSMKAGKYEVYAHWSVHPARPAAVTYDVTDSKGDMDSVIIDQTKKADQTTGGTFVASGWTLLGTYYFDISTPGSVSLTEVATGDTSADAVKFVHTNTLPDEPTAVSPANGSFSNIEPSILDWTSVIDGDDGSAVTYEIQVKDSSSTVVVNEIGLTVSQYDDSVNGYLTAEDDYSWKVRTSDGIGYSLWSSWSYFTKDITSPDITLIGITSVIVELGDAYTDKGVTAIDNVDGDISSSIVTVNPVDTSVVGVYTVTYDVKDAAGNDAVQVTRTVEVKDTIAPTSPVVIVTEAGDKEIGISWNAVGGASFYYVFIGTTNDASFVSKIKVFGTTHTHFVIGYGTYFVRVVAVDGSGNESLEADSITMQKSITLVAPVVETVVVTPIVVTPVTTVAPAPVVAAETTAPAVEEDTAEDSALDEDGIIKGDEEDSDDDVDEINWTPWVILFILIILAGAATGGYFYWFGDDEEVQTSVKEDSSKKDVAKPKSKDAKKKPRRW